MHGAFVITGFEDNDLSVLGSYIALAFVAGAVVLEGFTKDAIDEPSKGTDLARNSTGYRGIWRGAALAEGKDYSITRTKDGHQSQCPALLPLATRASSCTFHQSILYQGTPP